MKLLDVINVNQKMSNLLSVEYKRLELPKKNGNIRIEVLDTIEILELGSSLKFNAERIVKLIPEELFNVKVSFYNEFKVKEKMEVTKNQLIEMLKTDIRIFDMIYEKIALLISEMTIFQPGGMVTTPPYIVKDYKIK